MSDDTAGIGQPKDDNDKARISEWDSLDEARAAASASPALHNGSVLIRWERTEPDGSQAVVFSWRDTHVGGLNAPDGAIVCEIHRDGRWIAYSEDD